MALPKLVRFNELMDFYGALLTERQQRIARMHYEEDMSFAEIARDEKITRQAAHDAVKHATMSLEKFEKHLRLVELGRRGLGAIASTLCAAPTLSTSSTPDAAQAREAIVALRDRIRRSSGVIYSTDWIVKELDHSLALLKDENMD